MDYYEMLETINYLIKNIINQKIKLFSTSIIFDNEDYYEFYIDVFNDLEIEHIILEKMTKYMQLTNEDDFYLSDEIDLFEGIIKLFINSNIVRQIDIFNYLNILSNRYNIPISKSRVISKKTYYQLLDIIPKK